MQRKNKFLMQHATPPDFKIKLANFLQANVYQTVYLPPSGGPILSSPAKNEPGKKDAAKGGGRAVRERPAPSICFANAFD